MITHEDFVRILSAIDSNPPAGQLFRALIDLQCRTTDLYIKSTFTCAECGRAFTFADCVADGVRFVPCLYDKVICPNCYKSALHCPDDISHPLFEIVLALGRASIIAASDTCSADDLDRIRFYVAHADTLLDSI